LLLLASTAAGSPVECVDLAATLVGLIQSAKRIRTTSRVSGREETCWYVLLFLGPAAQRSGPDVSSRQSACPAGVAIIYSGFS
jgi:hypothetical protein